MEPQVFSKWLNCKFLTDLTDHTRLTKSDRMVDKQPFSLAIHKFDYAKFGRSDAVDWMCQSLNFKLLDLSEGTVIATSVQLTASTNWSIKLANFM